MMIFMHAIGFGLTNKCRTIVIFYCGAIKGYTSIAKNLFNLYAISAYFKPNLSL